MTEPTPNVDPGALILARVEVKLDNALVSLDRHGTVLDRHDTRLSLVENRVTAQETVVKQMQEDRASAPTRRGAIWTAIGVGAAIVIGLAGLIVPLVSR